MALLRDVIVSAYTKSRQPHAAAKHARVPPELFRLRQGQALAEVIAAIVRAAIAVAVPSLKRLAQQIR